MNDPSNLSLSRKEERHKLTFRIFPPSLTANRTDSPGDRDYGTLLRVQWQLAIPTLLTELPTLDPKLTPTRSCTQSPGSRPPTDSFSLLRACREEPPGGAMRTPQSLRFPYHLVFILFLRLDFGPRDFQSCPFKQLVLFIPRETKGESSHRYVAVSAWVTVPTSYEGHRS